MLACWSIYTKKKKKKEADEVEKGLLYRTFIFRQVWGFYMEFGFLFYVTQEATEEFLNRRMV